MKRSLFAVLSVGSGEPSALTVDLLHGFVELVVGHPPQVLLGDVSSCGVLSVDVLIELEDPPDLNAHFLCDSVCEHSGILFHGGAGAGGGGGGNGKGSDGEDDE
jgi:hypothetical protein